MKNIKYLIFVISALMLGSCKDSADDLQPLNAKFKCDKTEINPGETVSFMDQSDGMPVQWDWTFEGGEPATSQFFSPEVTYTTPGKYLVSLTVGRGDKSAEIVMSEYITVLYPNEIVPDFTSDKVQAMNNEYVTFTDNSTGFPTAWDWTFATKDGKQVKSTEQNPTLMLEAGIYTVTLHVSSPTAEATVTKEDYLNIIDYNAVAADFAATTSRTILEGWTVQFSDASIGRPTAWKWEFEGATPATSTEQNPKVTYNTTGIYKVTLTASNEKNQSVCTKDAYITVLPAADLELYLPFDGDFNDYSGKKHKVVDCTSGTKYKVHANGPSRHEGKFSVSFSGESTNSQTDYSFLSVTDADGLVGGNQSYTMAFWVMTTNKSQVQTLFQRGLSKGAVEGNADATDQYWCRLDKKAQGIRFYRYKTGEGGHDLKDKTADYRDSQWHSVIFVQDNNGTKTTLTSYVDGVKTASLDTSLSLNTAKLPFYIGCQTQIQNGKILALNHMQGCIDDLMMYGRAFTEQEVQTLYSMTK